MSGAAGGELAAHVSKAGGLGFIGGGYFSPEQYSTNLDQARRILHLEGTQNGRLDVGVGFLGWALSKLDRTETEPQRAVAVGDYAHRTKAIACIDAALQRRPRAVWLAFGTPDELVGWANVMREREKVVNEKEELEMWKLFVGVGSVEEARVAVEDVGADVIVAQGEYRRNQSYRVLTPSSGSEAGGHGSGSSPPLLNLLPSVAAALSTFKPLNRTPPVLLGAGGLSSGAHLASLLTLGAHGAVYGTRFLLTPESTYSATRKQLLLDAGHGQTKRSMAFDEARNTLEWPAGVDGRGIVNDTVKDYESGQYSLKARQERYGRADKEDDRERLIVWAGTGVGGVREIKPAGDVVREMEREAVKALRGVRGYLQE
jgi:nitronate monooxygenase